VIKFLFFGNKFDDNAVLLTSAVLKMVSIIMIPIAFSTIIGRFLFSQLKTKFFIYVSFVNLISGLIVLIIGKFQHNQNFLILGWVIANLCALIATIFFLKKEIDFTPINVHQLLFFILKNLCLIILSIILLYFLNLFQFKINIINILYTGISFSIGYILLFLLFFKNNTLLNSFK
jgi:peptidoglycan biosynthesis protein MviN/MurJ (putative lipid II flippase)